MPRRARLVVAGIPWHIIQRGNNRQACFFTTADYQRYLQDRVSRPGSSAVGSMTVA
jgi:REP element-mobilizing transposase RayT